MNVPAPGLPGATEFSTPAPVAAPQRESPPGAPSPERRRAQEALKALLALTASGTGEEFFCTVVRRLSELFGVKHVLVGVVEAASPGRVRTLAVWGDGTRQANFSYALRGTPCERVVGRELFHCPSGVQRSFPQDTMLLKLGVESYVGVPIHFAAGQPVGLLALLDTKRLVLPEVHRDMLGVLAVRVGNELERLRAEQALRESEERFHQLADRTEDIVWMMELQPAPRLVYLSPAFEQVYGTPRAEFLSDAALIDRHIHPADVAVVRQAFDDALRSEATRVSTEFRIVRPDGAERWLADNATITRSPDGCPGRVSGVSRDITRRKQAELAVLTERARFRDLFDHSPDAIFVETPAGVVLDVNQAACDLHGRPREELLGQHVAELVPPSQRASVERDFARAAAGRISVIEGYSLHRDGRAIPVELRISRLVHEGQPALLLQVRDITARKETELALESERARFRSLFENSPNAIWEADLADLCAWLTAHRAEAAGHLAAWLRGNPTARQHALGRARLLGMNRSALALHTATRLPEPESPLPGALLGVRGEAFAELCERLGHGATSFEFESASRREDGRPLHLLLDVYIPQSAGRSDYAHAILAGTDITERRLAATRLEGQRRVLELIARGQPLETVFTELVQQIESLCDGLVCCLFVRSEDGARLLAKAAPSLPPEALAALDGDPIATGVTTAALAARTGQPVEILDYETSPVAERCRALARRLGVRAGLAYPVCARDRQAIGVFGCYYATARPAPPAHLEVLDTACALFSVAVERAAHDRALEASARALTEANAALLALARSEAITGGDLNAALREITVAGARGVGVARASVWFLSADGTQLLCQDSYERASARHQGEEAITTDEHRLYFESIQRERLLVVPDAWHDPRTATLAAAYLMPLGVTSLIDAGVRQGERVTGIVCLEHVGPPRAWSPEQVLFAGSLADIVSLALQAHERQQAQAALLRSEEHYRSVVDALAEGVMLVDPEGRLTTINRAAGEILGLSAEDVQGVRLSDPVWNTIRPDGQPLAPADYPAAITLRTGQPQSDFVLGLRRPDEPPVWISINTRPLGVGPDGQATRAVVSFADITERRAAQQGLEERNAMLRAISDAQARFIGEAEPAETYLRMVENLVRLTGCEFGIVVEVEMTPEGTPSLAVQAFSERTRSAAHESFLAAHPLPELRLTRLDNLLGEVIRGGVPVLSADPAHDPRRGELPAGHPRLESYLGLPLIYAGRLVGVVGLGNRPGGFTLAQAAFLEPFLATCAGLIEALRDQRRRESAEAHIRRLNAELEQRVAERTAELAAMNEELGEFAYVVTHDLKAPLRGISQLSEWISRDHADQLNAEGLRYFELLRHRVLHLHRLVDGLLACARVGRTPEPEVMVNTHQLVHEVLGHLAPSGHVVLDVAADLPVVPANPQRLQQVFQNLLDNALKYLDKPQGLIRIRATRHGDEWEFSIADNGPGIPERYHEKVFQIFQRLTVDGGLPGTGLGLTLVKRIIENRGGRISIQATQGGGTTMLFRWPDQPRRPVPLDPRHPADASLYGKIPDRP